MVSEVVGVRVLLRERCARGKRAKRWPGIGLIAALLACALGCGSAPLATGQAPAHPPTPTEVLAASKPEDWRPPDPQHTLYLELRSGRVVLELAPSFAPHHVANIEALARQGYYDGLAIVRVQENYVVQWADPDAKRPVGNAQRTLVAEFERADRELPFVPLPDADTYASEVGFSNGFPAARDTAAGRAWLVHCYGMLGAGRDMSADSGGGTELYVVIGQAPRHLDRNVTLVGHVLSGMELLTSLPRGTGALGFYEKPDQRVPIRRLRMAADVPVAEQSALEVLRTDTSTFQALVEARRNRQDEWFHFAAGRIDVCNVPLVVRPRAQL
jgi:peptidylprolyl isomerase